MAFITITKPSTGDPVKKTSLLDAIIDNLIDLNARLTGVSDTTVINGDMELDQDANGVPDGWTWTAYTGGSVAMSTAKQFSGGKSVAITQPTGASNGGGYLTSTDYISVKKSALYALPFAIEVSRAASQNKVEVLWYTAALGLISTSTPYDSVANPTTFALQMTRLSAPATAVWAKIRLHGGLVASTGANITYFDSVELVEIRPVAYGVGYVAAATGAELAGTSNLMPGGKNVTFLSAGALGAATEYFRVRRSAAGTYQILVPASKLATDYIWTFDFNGLQVAAVLATTNVTNDTLQITTAGGVDNNWRFFAQLA